MAKIVNGISYNTHDDLVKLSELTPLEMAEIAFNTQIVGAMIAARNKQGISQKKLEELSGVSQPLIARVEKGRTDPQVTTLIRMLEPLGMTLAVVPKPPV